MLYKTYEEMLERYLNRLKGMYAKDDSIEWQKKVCKQCEQYEYRLKGILEFMCEAGYITLEQRDAEEKRVENTFSSISLFRLKLDVIEDSLYGYGENNA